MQPMIAFRRRTFAMACVPVIALLINFLVYEANAQQSIEQKQGNELTKGKKHALIICGLPGNDDYQQQYVESVAAIRDSLIDRFGFDKSNIRVQFGSTETQEPIEVFPVSGNASREQLEKEAKRLSLLTKEDEAWVFTLGQSYFDGKHVHLNLPDEDVDEVRFGKMFSSLRARALFVIGTPASGHFIKPLSKPNRIIITSAASDAETNGSIFHIALSGALTDISQNEQFDADKNGNISVLDLYVAISRNLSDLYYENDPPLIPTEHPLLDDDGDGRGSELQIDYLPLARGGRSDSKRKRRLRKFKDGLIAAKVSLPFAASDTAANSSEASQIGAEADAATFEQSTSAADE